MQEYSSDCDRTCQRSPLHCAHYVAERSYECLHLRLFADRHAHVRRQRWKQTPDLYVPLAYPRNQWVDWPLHIDHHKVRLRRNVPVTELANLIKDELFWLRV